MKTIYCFLLLPLSLSALPITPVINSSSVSINGTGESAGESFSYSASVRATMLAPFAAALSDLVRVTIPNRSYPAMASSSASQMSSVSGTHMVASGLTVSMAETFAGEGQERGRGVTESVSLFDLIFSLSGAVTYALAGELGAGEGEIFPDVARLTLVMIGGPTLIDLGQPVLNGPAGRWSRSFDFGGVLEPGTYRLTALASARSIGDYNSEDRGQAHFDFAMDFAPAAVPDSGVTAVMTVLTLAIIGLLRPRNTA